MAPPDKSLLPATFELQGLSDDKVRVIVELADRDSARSNAYAIVGMECGTVSFLGCLSAYVYLVIHSHDAAAGVVLGTTVLAIIGRIFAASSLMFGGGYAA